MKSGCGDQPTEKKRSVSLPVLAQSATPNEAIRHSRASRWRALALITLTLLMIAHVVQWRLSGRTVSPIEPSESMFTLQSGAINAGFIFFSLAILATLIFGRFVCGWACHIVALQDFCAWLLKKLGLKPKPFRSRLLVFVPVVVALYMFVWPTLARFFFGPPEQPVFPNFTNHLITTGFWDTFPPVWVAIPFLFICGFMTVYFLGQKGFCTYACPYGGFFGIADKFAPGKIRVTPDCNQCGHCTATCTSNVLVHAEVKKFGMVVDPGCMKCMDCVSVCPNDALYFGFGKPSLTTSGSIKKNFSLTWPEEIAAAIIFAASYFAVWDVYQKVPLLMALGIATVTTYLTMRSWQLIRASDLTFYRFVLKSGGRLQTAGWVFLSCSLLVLALNVHSGWIHYHESAGTRAFQRVQIPDELALARPNPGRWLSAADHAGIEAGKEHLRTATGFGFLTNAEALPKLAWLEYLSGNTEEAITLLGRSADHQTGSSRALNLYYRGAMLNRLGRYDQALASLDQALAAEPDLLLAREERGESLWLLGRRQDAVAAWNETVRRGPGFALANYLLAGAAAADGRADTAKEFETKGDQSLPADPLFNWMLGLRLQNVGMNDLAEKRFARAIELNPQFQRAR